LKILKIIKSRRIYSWEKETEKLKEGKSGEDPTGKPGLNTPKRIKKRKLRNKPSKKADEESSLKPMQVAPSE
jgi:hypothetical protein